MQPGQSRVSHEPAAAAPEVGGSKTQRGRVDEHLAKNNVDLAKTPATLGAPLRFDPKSGKFTGENSAAANQHHRRKEYRAPWIVHGWWRSMLGAQVTDPSHG